MLAAPGSEFKITKSGLQVAMKEFFGHNYLSDHCIDTIFSVIDEKNDGGICKEEFVAILASMDIEGDEEDDSEYIDLDIEAGPGGSRATSKIQLLSKNSSVHSMLSLDGTENQEDSKTTSRRQLLSKSSSVQSLLSSGGTEASNDDNISRTLRSSGVAGHRNRFGTGKTVKEDTGIAMKFVMDMSMHSKDHLNTWQMLYCGLTSISDDYGIDFKIEKFDW